MSFPCLETSAGSPSPTLGNSPNSLPWHTGSSTNMPFWLILVIFHYSVHLQSLSTCCYSMLLCFLLCLECLSLFTLPAMGILNQFIKAQRTCCLLPEPPSPVELISPLPAYPQHSVSPVLALTPSYFNFLFSHLSFPQAHEFIRARPTSCPSLFSQLSSPLPGTWLMLSDFVELSCVFWISVYKISRIALRTMGLPYFCTPLVSGIYVDSVGSSGIDT